MATFRFEARIIEWRGPSPFFFAPIPAERADAIRRAAKTASYGWGVVPVEAMLGKTSFTTSLIPKDGGYLLPLKDAVRRKANVTAGVAIRVTMTIQPRS